MKPVSSWSVPGITFTLLELQAFVFGQKNWAFDYSCFEESGLPSNPIVLAWAFTAAEATALDYSSADSVSNHPQAHTQTLLLRCCSIAQSPTRHCR